MFSVIILYSFWKRRFTFSPMTNSWEWMEEVIMESFYLGWHLGSVIFYNIKALQWSFSATLEMIICVWQSKWFLNILQHSYPNHSVTQMQPWRESGKLVGFGLWYVSKIYKSSSEFAIALLFLYLAYLLEMWRHNFKNTEGVFLGMLSENLSLNIAYCLFHHIFQSVRFSKPHYALQRAVQKGTLCRIIRLLPNYR